jgi:putative flippase GtrA
MQVAAFFRFGVVGVLTAGIYALILAITVKAGESAAVGVALAYILAVGFNYWAHYQWTYRTDRPHRSSGPRYLLVIAVIFCINVAATAFLPGLLGIGYVEVQIALAAIAAAVTFAAQTIWVFSRRADAP